MIKENCFRIPVDAIHAKGGVSKEWMLLPSGTDFFAHGIDANGLFCVYFNTYPSSNLVWHRVVIRRVFFTKLYTVNVYRY